MAKLNLSKSGLQKQREELNLYQRLLPSLDLKRMQLSAELKRARQQLAEAEAEVEKLNQRIAEQLPMLANREIDVSGLVRVESFQVEEENLVENSRVVGEYLLEGLKAMTDMPLVGHVRGKGLFCGLELVKDKETREPFAPELRVGPRVLAAGYEAGVVVRGLGGDDYFASDDNSAITTLDGGAGAALDSSSGAHGHSSVRFHSRVQVSRRVPTG